MTKDEALDLALEALENNRREHYYCEDTWYSCPKHEDGCANEAQGDKCNCGVDKANQEIDRAITAIKQASSAPVQEPVAEVKAKMTGGNVGIATVIHEIYSPHREPLQPGDKLYAGHRWMGWDIEQVWSERIFGIDMRFESLQDALKFRDKLDEATPPAAPVQEPVYHLRQYGDVTKEQLDRYIATGDINPQPAPVQEPVWIQPDHLQKAQKAPFLCRVEPHKRDDFVPLYTTPPAAQRQWVEVEQVKWDGEKFIAKLKEKNGM